MLLAAILAISGAAPAAEVPGTITADALLERRAAGAAPIIIDVRTRQEFAAGHVPGARNLPIQEIGRRLDELAGLEGDELVIYCESGPRARAAHTGLERLGFVRLRVLEGHMRAWRAGGRPTARP